MHPAAQLSLFLLSPGKLISYVTWRTYCHRSHKVVRRGDRHHSLDLLTPRRRERKTNRILPASPTAIAIVTDLDTINSADAIRQTRTHRATLRGVSSSIML